MRRLVWLTVIGGTVLVTVLATWLALDLLLGEADRAGAADRPAARIDAIRTGLTVAAGAGALFALGLALRRQWYTEHDSQERRITELYVRAVEQLGSEHATVRLGGLYALARLGQGNRDHRQTVLDVLCAYLRMPFDEGPEDELQVRQTAQGLLAKHLSRGAHFWPDMNLNLRGATLVGFNFTGCEVSNADFSRAKFTGQPALFTLAVFGAVAWFDQATFEAWPSFVGTRLGYASSAWRLERAAMGNGWRFLSESGAVDGDRVEGAGE